MANYVHNRIICNEKTASHLLTDDENEKYEEYFNDRDKWYSTIDFRKALDVPIWNYDSKYVPQEYGNGIEVIKTNNNKYDIRFDTRWFAPYDIILDFISKYKDVDWYAFEEEILEEEHYYWYKDKVVNDMNTVDDEIVSREYWHYDEDDYELEDDRSIFDLIQTPRYDQDKFVNYNPDKKSKEYHEYLELINKYADMAINDVKNNRIYYSKEFEEYGYNERLYRIDCTIRLKYLHNLNIDRNKYSFSIMSLDISDLIIEKLKLKTNYNPNFKTDVKEGDEVIIKKDGAHGVVESIYKASIDKFVIRICEKRDDSGYPVKDFKRCEFDIITVPYKPIETPKELIDNILKIKVDNWVIKKVKRFKSTQETENYIRDLIINNKAHIYTDGYEWYIRSNEDLIEVNKYSYNVTYINMKEFSKWK